MIGGWPLLVCFVDGCRITYLSHRCRNDHGPVKAVSTISGTVFLAVMRLVLRLHRLPCRQILNRSDMVGVDGLALLVAKNHLAFESVSSLSKIGSRRHQSLWDHVRLPRRLFRLRCSCCYTSDDRSSNDGSTPDRDQNRTWNHSPQCFRRTLLQVSVSLWTDDEDLKQWNPSLVRWRWSAVRDLWASCLENSQTNSRDSPGARTVKSIPVWWKSSGVELSPDCWAMSADQLMTRLRSCVPYGSTKRLLKVYLQCSSGTQVKLKKHRRRDFSMLKLFI